MRKQIKSHIPTIKEKMHIPDDHPPVRNIPVEIEVSKIRKEQDEEDAYKVTKASYAVAKD